MQAWLLLIHDGTGAAQKVRLQLFPGRPVSRPEALALHKVELNGMPADAHAEACVLYGLQLLAHTFKDNAAWPLQELSGWHLSTEKPDLNIAGRSGELLLAMCTYLKCLSRFGGRLRDARIGASRPFAATGTLDARGRVGRIEGAGAKLDAAARTLPEGGLVFIPEANRSDIDPEALNRSRTDRDIEVVFVDNIQQALQLLGVTVSILWKQPPWQALGQYRVEHQPIYFGRSSEIQDLIRALLKNERLAPDATETQPRPGVLVMAASGLGKSSFIQAGLLAQLRQLPDPDYRPLEYAIWRPRVALQGLAQAGDEAAIARSVAQNWACSDGENATGFAFDSQAAQGADLQALAQQLQQQRRRGWRTVWVVDQLEELFSLNFTPQARIAFAHLLKRLQEQGVWVVATLRTEFTSDFAQLVDDERRAVLVDVFEGREYHLRPMQAAGLQDVIHGPARAADLSFGRHPAGMSLDTELFAQAIKGDSAPLLGYAMHMIWKFATEEAKAKGQSHAAVELGFRHYEMLGDTEKDGIKGVIGRVADEAYGSDEIDDRARGELHRLLDDLSVTVNEVGKQKDAARPASLRNWPSASPGGRLVQQLMTKGLLEYDYDEKGDPQQVRVAHELLFLHWKEAREYLAASQPDRIIIERFKAAHQAWIDRSMPADMLLTSAADLHAAQGLQRKLAGRAEHAELLRFVRLSIQADKEKQRAARRIRWYLMAAVAVGLTATAGFLLAYNYSLAKAEEASLQEAARNLLQGQQRLEAGDPLGGIQHALSSMAQRKVEVPGPDEEAVLLRALLMWQPMKELQLPVQKDPDTTAQISDDGRKLLTVSRDGQTRVLDIGSPAQASVLQHGGVLQFAGFSDANGQLLARSSDRLRLWSTTGVLLFDRPISPFEKILDVNTSTGQVLIGASRSIRTLELATGRERVLPKVDRVIFGAFNDAGTLVVMTDNKGVATLWQLKGSHAETTELGTSRNRSSFGQQALFSADGHWLAAGFDDRTLQLCNLFGMKPRCQGLEVAKPDALASPNRKDQHQDMHLAFSPYSSRLYALIHAQVSSRSGEPESGESGLGVWALNDNRGPELLGMIGLPRRPTQMAISPSGDRVVLAGRGHTVQALDLTMPVWDASDVAIFPPGRSLLKMFRGRSPGDLYFLDSKGAITVWDPEPRYPRRLLVDPYGPYVNTFSFSPDGSGLSTNASTARKDWTFVRNRAGELSTASLTGLDLKPRSDLEKGSTAQTSGSPPEHPSTCWETLAESSSVRRQIGPFEARIEPGTNLIVRLPTGEERPLPDSANVRCMAASKDGRYIAAADALHIVYVWKVDSRTGAVQGHGRIQFNGHRNRISDLVFSLDGQRLLSSSEDGTARLWMLGGTSRVPVVLEGHNGGVLYADFDPSGNLVGTLSRDGQLRIWETPSGAALLQLARTVAGSERPCIQPCSAPLRR